MKIEEISDVLSGLGLRSSLKEMDVAVDKNQLEKVFERIRSYPVPPSTFPLFTMVVALDQEKIEAK